ncbi:putative ribonuclease H-like domain-containing protein [Tanacetum coccineum]
MIRETTEMIMQIKNRLLAARSRQKSYADVRRKPLEFEVGDKVMLKVSPWKGVVRFGKHEELITSTRRSKGCLKFDGTRVVDRKYTWEWEGNLCGRNILISLILIRNGRQDELIFEDEDPFLGENAVTIRQIQVLEDYNGGPVAFGGSKGYITGKGKIKTRKLDFEDVCFVKELQHFNLFSVSQMCDKKNKVLFTDTECLVLSSDFKFPNENQILRTIPRQNNMYNFKLENIVPSRGLACLIANDTIDESNKCHRRLGHVNFKNLNKVVKGNLVRGLPSRIILQNDSQKTCVACQKGKQHKASCKAKSVQEKQIHAIVDSKVVVVTEASIRSSLLLNDVDGTACLTNEAIFQNLALMGYEGELDKLTFQNPSFLLNGIQETNPLVIASSTSHDTTQDSRDSLEGTNGSEGDQVQPSYDSPLSGDHKSEKVKGGLNLEELFALCTNLSNRGGEKNAQPEPTLDAFDDLDADGRDYMETEDVVKEGRQSNETEELNKGQCNKEDAEIARQLQIDLQAEVERERQREEEAFKAAIAEMYDEVQAGIDADALAVQRSAEIRSRQPTKSQLRNLMMTYLKNMGGYKRSRLKAKTFAEIQGLYERQKRVIDDFKPMDSDDAIKDSKEAAGVHKQKVLKEPNSTKVEANGYW